MNYPHVRLDECARIVSGATPSTTTAEYWDGNIPWATPADLSKLDGALISETPRTITEKGLSSCAAEILPTNSVLFSSRAPIGHVAINTVPMATNQGFKSFVPERDKLESKYLYYWLRANRAYLDSLGNGATFKELSKAAVSRVKLPLPPLKEQRRIAAILDQADDLRRKRREASEQTSSLALALLNHTLDNLTDHETKYLLLDEIVRDNDRINYGVIQPGPQADGGVPLVRVENVVNEDFSITALKSISPEIDQQYNRSRLRGDEILIACVGSVGALTLAAHPQRGFNIARAVARIPIDPSKADRVFISEALKRDDVQNYFKSETRTVAQPTLNIKQICQTRVPVPPLPLQQAFAARVAEIDKLKAQHRAHLARLDTLFASLQHRAFRGEL